jgi:hypothetical protein
MCWVEFPDLGIVSWMLPSVTDVWRSEISRFSSLSQGELGWWLTCCWSQLADLASSRLEPVSWVVVGVTQPLWRI